MFDIHYTLTGNSTTVYILLMKQQTHNVSKGVAAYKVLFVAKGGSYFTPPLHNA